MQEHTTLGGALTLGLVVLINVLAGPGPASHGPLRYPDVTHSTASHNRRVRGGVIARNVNRSGYLGQHPTQPWRVEGSIHTFTQQRTCSPGPGDYRI